MTRVLVLGGTGWLGGEIARRWVERGADVTAVARGLHGDAAEGVRLIVADRGSDGWAEELDGEWDEVVDVTNEPSHARAAVAALAGRCGHWTYISSVSVYRDHDRADASEDAPLVEPIDPPDFPSAKVMAEAAVEAAVGGSALIVRPGLIVGPGDASDRCGYWPARFARGGSVLVPDPAAQFVQVIDVADLARFVVSAGAKRMVGRVDAVGPSIPMAEFFEAARVAVGFRGETVAVASEELRSAGVEYWAGPSSLPLWLPSDHAGMCRRSGAIFRSLGGTTMPLSETIDRVARDERARGIDRERRSGLTPDAERAVLDAVSAVRRGGPAGPLT